MSEGWIFFLTKKWQRLLMNNLKLQLEYNESLPKWFGLVKMLVITFKTIAYVSKNSKNFFFKSIYNFFFGEVSYYFFSNNFFDDSECLQLFLSILKLVGQCTGGSLWLSGETPKPLFSWYKSVFNIFYKICKFWSFWGGLVGTAHPSVGQAHLTK